MQDLQDSTTLDKIWYRDLMPEVTKTKSMTS